MTMLSACPTEPDARLRSAERSSPLTELLEAEWVGGFVMHQAYGMLAVQLGVTSPDAFASLCAKPCETRRPIHDIARDVVKRS